MTDKIVTFEEGETVQFVRGPADRPVEKLKVINDPGGHRLVRCYSFISKREDNYARSALKKTR